jgi:DNA-binding transcriptional LysR family regulator
MIIPYMFIIVVAMDRLTSLKVFAQVVDLGGFSAAARRLNMSTTMVSNHVQALEDHLGARLLNRTTRRVGVTEVGRAYYERCTRILAEIDEADRAAGELQSKPRGTLRMHSNTAIARFIGPVVTEYLALYPEVAVELMTGERPVDIVDEGYDIGIRIMMPSDSSLTVRHLANWHHVLCASPRYLETHAAPTQLADLAQHNCLRYVYYAYDEWRFVDAKGEPTSVRVSGNLLTSSADTLRIAALEGRGIFLAPGFVAAPELEAGLLVPLLPEYRPIDFAITALYPHRHHLSAKVRAFIDLLARRIVAYRNWLEPNIPALMAARPETKSAG